MENISKKLLLTFKDMKNMIEPIELREFVKSTIEQIESGADFSKRDFKGPIEFEVSINETKKMGGGIKVYVVSGNKISENEQIAKIKFKIYPKKQKSEQNFEELNLNTDY